MANDVIDLLAPWPVPAASDESQRVSEAELAAEWDMTSRRVQQLVKDGIIKKVGRGAAAFDRRAATRAYVTWLRAKASRGVAVQDDLKLARITLVKAQAEKAETAAAAARGELVSAVEVQSGWASILRDVRSAILAVPSRCGETLPHLTGHDVATIDAEIKAALEALADGH